ncbi:MAG: purine-nucleoside phosphorylase [Clostridia bacterium]|nr:purine-nucleoside phosphorylase [Clostridia bacterium]
MATPHNQAKLGDFAKTVLMPGDPKRSKYIADNFLENARLVNDVRGAQGYTGTYKGVPVSVMASGMGIPSMAIHSHELFNFYGVENIIRVGSAGALVPNVELRSIVLAMGASTDSNYVSTFGLNGSFAPICSYKLLSLAESECKKLGTKYTVGGVLSSDVFYGDATSSLNWAKLNVLAVEMESVALYANASRCAKNALSILTVSDSLVTGEATTSEEREKTFTDMMKVALEVAVKLNGENND